MQLVFKYPKYFVVNHTSDIGRIGENRDWREYMGSLHLFSLHNMHLFDIQHFFLLVARLKCKTKNLRDSN